MVWEFLPDRHPRWHTHPLKLQKLESRLVVVTRKDWNALNPLYQDPVDHPVNNVRVVQTHTETCGSPAECGPLLQKLQETQMRKRQPDINYNFLIGSDGSVYEGRGWHLDCHMAPKFAKIEEDCLTIAMIGSFDEKGTDIPATMTASLDRIIKTGIQKGYIDCCHRFIPFRNFEK